MQVLSDGTELQWPGCAQLLGVRWIAAFVCWVLLLLEAIACGQSVEEVSPGREDPLQQLAVRVCAQSGSPGVWLAWGSVGEPPRLAAAGVRKHGEAIRATVDDQLHLGSCTKAMTSVLMAKLVEQGHLQWSSTLADVAPELASEIPESHRLVTLEQLLQHRSGFPANARDWWMRQGTGVPEIRRAILLDSLNRLKLMPPGEEELYSNLGYLGAGIIAESVTGESWEALMTAKLFEPLRLHSAGFGPPSSEGRIDQPWGHLLDDGQLRAGQFDNAPALGPAGTVHLALGDWFSFCELFAGGGPARFLKPETLGKLVEPALNPEYAYGWVVLDRPWAQGRILLHSGSNRWWFCKVCIAPRLKQIYLCVFNRGGDEMDQWAEVAFREMIQLSSRRSGPPGGK